MKTTPSLSNGATVQCVTLPGRARQVLAEAHACALVYLCVRTCGHVRAYRAAEVGRVGGRALRRSRLMTAFHINFSVMLTNQSRSIVSAVIMGRGQRAMLSRTLSPGVSAVVCFPSKATLQPTRCCQHTTKVTMHGGWNVGDRHRRGMRSGSLRNLLSNTTFTAVAIRQLRMHAPFRTMKKYSWCSS